MDSFRFKQTCGFPLILADVDGTCELSEASLMLMIASTNTHNTTNFILCCNKNLVFAGPNRPGDPVIDCCRCKSRHRPAANTQSLAYFTPESELGLTFCRPGRNAAASGYGRHRTLSPNSFGMMATRKRQFWWTLQPRMPTGSYVQKGAPGPRKHHRVRRSAGAAAAARRL